MAPSEVYLSAASDDGPKESLLAAAEEEAEDDLTCDIAVIGGGVAFQHALKTCARDAKKSGEPAPSVTACLGNGFLEFSHAAPVFLADPTKHKSFLCGEVEAFAVDGVRYVADAVTRVDPEARTITFAHRKSKLTYKALIVATGRRLPLLMPRPGDSLLERMEEVRNVGRCLRRATSVLLVGAGLVGVEVAADIRIRHPQIQHVYLLSRTGEPLPDERELPATTRAKVAAVLSRMGVTLVRGSLAEEQRETLLPDVTNPQLTAGVALLAPGSWSLNTPGEPLEEIAFDVYLPTYMQGPNTTFLAGTGVLDAEGRIEATSCLQSKARPEIFGAGVTTMPLLGHPVAARMAAEGVTCATNAQLFLQGVRPTALLPHKDDAVPTPAKLPDAIKIGHGPKGHAIWMEHTRWEPPGLLMCGPCYGGFPCCPPPCCWCCAPGCATCCGTCGKPAEGSGVAAFYESTLLPYYMRERLGARAGILPPEAMEMTRQPL